MNFVCNYGKRVRSVGKRNWRTKTCRKALSVSSGNLRQTRPTDFGKTCASGWEAAKHKSTQLRVAPDRATRIFCMRKAELLHNN